LRTQFIATIGIIANVRTIVTIGTIAIAGNDSNCGER